RLRRVDSLERAADRLAERVEFERFQQFLFDRQWRALREYALAREVRIIGDVPIFVAYDSADVWARRELFRLGADAEPEAVSGVPPDYFSGTGQRWGNPLYRWKAIREEGYSWWIERFRRTLSLVDIARIDHFRGFESYWEIPADEETAIYGQWRKGPGAELFRAVREALGVLPLIAEDLGLITEEVEALRDELGLPGMRVLQFGLGGGVENPHHPRSFPENSVAYTGTHDNDTALGWLRHEATSAERERLFSLVADPGGEINWEMLRLVHASPARFAVVPVQDILGLGSSARMNTPGSSEGNWAWRLEDGTLTEALQGRLLAITRASGRAP
nr:4-alpha-glucanotransferase [Gemmatimonadota bacterium]